MGCLGVCGPARARRLRQCSDRMGSAVLVLGLGTIFPMGIPDSFIPQQQPRKKICQGFRRWKAKSDIMDDANERTTDCKRQFAPNQQPAAVNCPTGRMRVGLAGFGIRPRSRSRRFRFQMQLTRFLIESFLVQGGDGDGDSEERACETSPMESPCRTAEARTRGGRTGCRRGQREKEEGGRFARFVRCGFPARGMRRGRGRESSPGNW